MYKLKVAYCLYILAYNEGISRLHNFNKLAAHMQQSLLMSQKNFAAVKWRQWQSGVDVKSVVMAYCDWPSRPVHLLILLPGRRLATASLLWRRRKVCPVVPTQGVRCCHEAQSDMTAGVSLTPDTTSTLAVGLAPLTVSAAEQKQINTYSSSSSSSSR